MAINHQIITHLSHFIAIYVQNAPLSPIFAIWWSKVNIKYPFGWYICDFGMNLGVFVWFCDILRPIWPHSPHIWAGGVDFVQKTGKNPPTPPIYAKYPQKVPKNEQKVAIFDDFSPFLTHFPKHFNIFHKHFDKTAKHFTIFRTTPPSIEWSHDWLIDRSIDWSLDWLIDRVIW